MQINTDKEGFLIDLESWDRDVAEALAYEEGIKLTQEHWELIDLIRDFYQQFEVSPAMRPLIKFIKTRLSTDKANSIYLMTLFPESPAKILAKIAGLPKPENCL